MVRNDRRVRNNILKNLAIIDTRKQIWFSYVNQAQFIRDIFYQAISIQQKKMDICTIFFFRFVSVNTMWEVHAKKKEKIIIIIIIIKKNNLYNLSFSTSLILN